jgi:GR25 family glycosyltransferase involved in LPS biosynthesis
LGCSMSRIRVLMMPKERNLDYIVILEDDIYFKKPRIF